MLNLFRKNTKVIIWSVIIAFALWGGFSVGSQFKEDGRYAGQVFGKNISYQEFDRFYRSTQMFNFSGDEAKDPDLVRESAWQGVIFSREAKRLRIEISDNEVREQILKLLDNQKVNPENYQTWLERGLRLSPQQFEEMVREVLRVQKLLAQFAPTDSSLEVTPDEAKKAFLQEKDRIAAEFVTFSDKGAAEAFRKKIKTPEEWANEKKGQPKLFKTTGGLVPTNLFSNFLQLNPADSLNLQILEKNHFSNVVATGKEFSVFLITDRVLADEKEFDAQKSTFIKKLKEQKKENAILIKTREILDRAHLVDNLKKNT